MVIESPRFIDWLGPAYGLFSDDEGYFTVARRADVSSASGEVLQLLGNASSPRFRCIVESGIEFSSGSTDDICMGEIVEFVEIERVYFSFGSGVDEPLYTVASMFYSLIKVYGGWREFVREVRTDGGSLMLDHFDEDGMDYERLADYSVRLMLTGKKSDRLMKSERAGLWG